MILAGYDDEVAYLSDTGFEDLQTTKLERLAERATDAHPVFPLEGQMLAVPDPDALRDPSSAADRAIERNTRQMIEPAMGEIEGLPGLRRFAQRLLRDGRRSSRTGSGARASATR